MKFECINCSRFRLTAVFFFVIVFSILHPTNQNLFEKVLEEKFEEKLHANENTRFSQNEKFYVASGVRQSLACGLNSLSLNRRHRRQNEPQGRNEWPWIAVFLDKHGYLQFCGGTLLNHRYVLTAAHCFKEPGREKTKDDIIVRLGEYDLFREDETKHQDFEAEKIICHQLYDPADERNDIALVKLAGRVHYDQYIRPLCLPTFTVKSNQSTIVAGWGTKKADENDHSNVLLDVEVPVVGYDQCSYLIGPSNAVDKEKHICAGGVSGKDSCQGDSGGPLIVQATNKEKRWMIVGIVSFGLGCGSEYSPGVYTNVKNYLDWIGKRIVDAAP